MGGVHVALLISFLLTTALLWFHCWVDWQYKRMQGEGEARLLVFADPSSIQLLPSLPLSSHKVIVTMGVLHRDL